MFFKFLFDIAKPPVRDAPGAFFCFGGPAMESLGTGAQGG